MSISLQSIWSDFCGFENMHVKFITCGRQNEAGMISLEMRSFSGSPHLDAGSLEDFILQVKGKH